MTFEDILSDKFSIDNKELDDLFFIWDKKGLVGCSRMEYQILNTLVSKPNVRDVLELGPGKGASTEAMRLGLKDKPKFSITIIDIDKGNILPLTTRLENMQFFDDGTDEFFKDNLMFFDMIFIDANHTDAQSFKDIESSLKFLNKDGIVACHDIMHGGNTTDIHRHVKDLSSKFRKNYKMIDQFGNGIGLIY